MDVIYEHTKLSMAASVCSVHRDTPLQYAPQDKMGLKHLQGFGEERCAWWHAGCPASPHSQGYASVLGPEEPPHFQQQQEQNYCRTRAV